MTNNTKFITFEGGDGGGKSTQAKLLAKHLEKQGVKVCLTYEPFLPSIRSLLLNADQNWQPISETLLFITDRYEHLQSIVKPALERGEWVICDRFSDSTVAYQGYGHGLGEGFVRELHELAKIETQPDITFILDISVEIGIKRALSRRGTEERFENMDISFHHKLREGFLDIAKKEPERCKVIDANAGIDEIHKKILEILE